MKRNYCAVVSIVALVGLLTSVSPSPVRADVPGQMSYQGYLRDSTGQPVTGFVNFAFRIYPDSTGGVACWGPEEHLDVSVVDGLFELVLGRATPLTPSCFQGTLMWLETWVSGAPLSPRKPITSSAYAFAADSGGFEHVALLVHNDGEAIPVGGDVDQLAFSTAEIDTHNAWSPATGRFQPAVAGTYMVTVQATQWYPIEPGCRVVLRIHRNGGHSYADQAVASQDATSTPYILTTSVSKLFVMNGSSDYLEFWYESQYDGTVSGLQNITFAQVFRVQ